LDTYILIRGARQLLTLHGPPGIRRGQDMNDLGLIEDGSVLIRNDQIAAVGPTRRLENLREARNAAVIPAAGRIVIPGFVDAALRLMTGSTLRAARQSNLNRMAQEAAGVLRSALQHGTTRAEVKIGGSNPADELKALKSIKRMETTGEFVRTWLARLLPGENGLDAAATRELHFEYVSKKMRDSFLEVETGPGTATAAARLFAAAAEYRLPAKLSWTGAPDRVLLDLMSTFRPHTLSGLEELDEALMKALCTLQTTLVLTGGESTLRVDKQALCVREFVDTGGGIALASGYDPVHSPTFNMQMAIALAVGRLQLTPEEAITAATINAAYASGIGRTTGSLEAGKQADLILLNLSGYRDLPRQFGINHVGLVIRGGNVVFNRIGWKPPRTA
jgi:imidazolonepropionase